MIAKNDLVWLIEANVFGTDAEPVKRALASAAIPYEIIQPGRFLNGWMPVVWGKQVDQWPNVFFWGRPPLMWHIQRHYPNWNPGGFCTFANYDCEVYYPKLSEYLLNSRCHVAGLDQLLIDQDDLFAEFERNGKVFVRPCSLEKTFPGKVVGRDEFRLLLEGARYANPRVLVSRPVPISREWRVIVEGGRAVCGCQYLAGGRLNIDPAIPKEVEAFVDDVWQSVQWTPDRMFVADVGSCDGGEFKLVEINSLSCSGWYQCNPAKIVEAVRCVVNSQNDGI